MPTTVQFVSGAVTLVVESTVKVRFVTGELLVKLNWKWPSGRVIAPVRVTGLIAANCVTRTLWPSKLICAIRRFPLAASFCHSCTPEEVTSWVAVHGLVELGSGK